MTWCMYSCSGLQLCLSIWHMVLNLCKSFGVAGRAVTLMPVTIVHLIWTFPRPGLFVVALYWITAYISCAIFHCVEQVQLILFHSLHSLLEFRCYISFQVCYSALFNVVVVISVHSVAIDLTYITVPSFCWENKPPVQERRWRQIPEVAFMRRMVKKSIKITQRTLNTWEINTRQYSSRIRWKLGWPWISAKSTLKVGETIVEKLPRIKPRRRRRQHLEVPHLTKVLYWTALAFHTDRLPKTSQVLSEQKEKLVSSWVIRMLVPIMSQ